MDIPNLWVILHQYRTWDGDLVWGIPTVICETTVFPTEEAAQQRVDYWRDMGNESTLAVVKMTAVDVREV